DVPELDRVELLGQLLALLPVLEEGAERVAEPVAGVAVERLDRAAVELGDGAAHRRARDALDLAGEHEDDVVERLLGGPATAHGPLRLHPRRLGRPPTELEEDVLLVGEVEVERALGDARGAGDLLDG